MHLDAVREAMENKGLREEVERDGIKVIGGDPNNPVTEDMKRRAME